MKRFNKFFKWMVLWEEPVLMIMLVVLIFSFFWHSYVFNYTPEIIVIFSILWVIIGTVGETLTR